jgi:hypothetical protein
MNASASWKVFSSEGAGPPSVSGLTLFFEGALFFETFFLFKNCQDIISTDEVTSHAHLACFRASTVSSSILVPAEII